MHRIIHSQERRYELQRSLGKGSTGEVFLAQEPGAEQQLALKLLHSNVPDEDLLAFKAEFTALCNVRSPHVCAVHDFGQCQESKAYFFTADYIAGKTLYQSCTQPSTTQQLHITTQLLQACAAIHAQGLVHRDIKGANIVIATSTSDSTCTLVDFGFACAQHDAAQRPSGTLYYMAPELIAAQGSATPQSDLFALGITLYRFITGEYPCAAPQLSALREWQRHCTLDEAALRNAGAPDFLIRCLQKLTATNPNQRYHSAQAALRYLALHDSSIDHNVTQAQHEPLHNGPLVGRDTLLQQFAIRSQQIHAQPADTHCYYLRGPRGSGRSRLLRELKHICQLQELRTIFIDGAQHDAIRMLDQALGLSDCSVHDYMTRAAAIRSTPTALLLDNLHHATPVVQHMCKALAFHCMQRRLVGQSAPYLLIASCALDFSPPAEPVHSTIDLTQLSEHDIATFLQELQAPDPQLANWSQQIYAYSAGLPELVIHATERCLSGQSIPSSHNELFTEQIAALTEPAQQLLTVLAHCSHGLTSNELLALTLPAIEQHLATLESRRLVHYAATEHRYHIMSKALRDTMYSEPLSTAHHAQFDALLTHAQQHNAPPAHLSCYAERSSVPSQALPYLDTLIDTAEQAGQTQQAIALCERRQRISPELAITRKLGRLNLLAGRLETAAQLLDTLPQSNPEERIAVHCEQGWVARVRRDPAQALQHFEAALQLCSDDTPATTRLRIHNECAQCLYEQGHFRQAATLFAQSEHEASALSSSQQRELSNNNLGNALAMCGDITAAEEFYAKKLARFTEDLRTTLSIHNQRGTMRLHAKNNNGALHDFCTAWELMQSSGNIHNAFPVLGNIISLLQLRADYAAALRYAEHCMALIDDHEHNPQRAQLLLSLAQLYLSMHCDSVSASYLQLAQAALEHAAPELRTWVTLAQSALALAQHDPKTAEQLATPLCSNTHPTLAQWARISYAEAAIALKQHDNALQQLKPLFSGDITTNQELRAHILRAKITPQPTTQLLAWLHLAESEQWQEQCAEICTLVAQQHTEPHETEMWLRRALEYYDNIATKLGEEYADTYLQHHSVQTLLREHRDCIATLQNTARDLSTPPESQGAPDMLALEKVLHIMKQLASEHDPERLLHRMVDEAINISGAERGLLLTPDGDNMIISVARNADTSADQPKYSHSIVDQVLRTGKAVTTIDAPGDDDIDLTQSIVSLKLQSIICLPLMFTGKLRGIIYLDSQTRSHPITPELTKALEMFAEQAAVALMNAEKIAESTRAREQAEAERNSTKSALDATQAKIEQLSAQVRESHTPRETRYRYDNIIGTSKGIRNVLHVLDKVTATNAAIHVSGETGTGKELIAKALHFNNPHRKAQRFVAINCAALPDSILESELFGYRKGAFTGAERDKPGMFEEADGGTLFLDEIGDMPLAMQAKILRCIQEGEVRRLGDDTVRAINVRIVSASNQDLQKAVSEGRFRQDLLYRIGGLQVHLPPLRERREDIPLLCQHFVKRAISEHQLSEDLKLSSSALHTLQQHSWPGNVRELEHVITNALLLSDSESIGAEALPIINADTTPDVSTSQASTATASYNPSKTLKDYEADIIVQALDHFGGNKSKTADALGITRMTLAKKLKSYGVG